MPKARQPTTAFYDTKSYDRQYFEDAARAQGFALHTKQAPLRVPEGELAPVELYVHVEDLAAAITKLRNAGARQLAPVESKDWGDDAAYFADPFGNVLAIARPRS